MASLESATQVVSLLNALLDELGPEPSYRRVELRTLRGRFCRLYGLPDPQQRADDAALAWAQG